MLSDELRRYSDRMIKDCPSVVKYLKEGKYALPWVRMSFFIRMANAPCRFRILSTYQLDRSSSYFEKNPSTKKLRVLLKCLGINIHMNSYIGVHLSFIVKVDSIVGNWDK